MASCVSVSCLFNQWHRPLFHSNFVSNYVTGCLHLFCSLSLCLAHFLFSGYFWFGRPHSMRKSEFFLFTINSPINYNKTDLDAWAVEYQWATFRFECIVCVFVMVSIVLPFAQCLRSAHSSRKIRDSAYGWSIMSCAFRWCDHAHTHAHISLDVCGVRLKCFTMCAVYRYARIAVLISWCVFGASAHSLTYAPHSHISRTLSQSLLSSYYFIFSWPRLISSVSPPPQLN